MCARLAKNDSNVMNKLRELKFKYSEGSISSPGQNLSPMQSHSPDNKQGEGNMALSVI